jgi:catechol 2,3-dioxygenase-like lactoylglutathione lyase family enzyme
MFKPITSFSGFSAPDLDAAYVFYAETLGLEIKKEAMGLQLQHSGGGTTFIYPKPDHQPATYTILNFVVEDIDAAVEDLQSRGISFEQYGLDWQDDKGIARGLANNQGPDIAWFKDPAGNILAVLQDTPRQK